MKKLALITVSSLVISTAAFADDQGALCSMLASHQAMTAAYQPGVDANGNAVAPADVNAQAMAGMPDILRVPVTVDMAKQLTAGWPAGTEMKSDMGVVELHKDGRITLGGQDVKNNTWAMCSKTAKEATPAPGSAKSAEKSSHKAHHASAKKHKKVVNEVAADKAPEESPVASEQVPAPAAMPSEEPSNEAVKNEAPWSAGGAEPAAPAPAAGGEPTAPPQPAAPPAISPPAAPAGSAAAPPAAPDAGAAPWDAPKTP